MTVIDDLISAANDYPTTDVVLEIVNVTFPGSVINTNEEGTFKVKIHNNGSLELDNVKLTITGENGVQVKGTAASATYGPSLGLNPADPIAPNSTVTLPASGDPLGFKAPSSSFSTSKTLIKATLSEYDVNLDTLLTDLDGPSTAVKGTYSAPVSPV
jgi:hypothetical protein